MYARVTTFKVEPARLPELSAKIEELAHIAKALPGIVDAYVGWREDGQGVLVGVYNSKREADRAVMRIQAVWGRFAEVLAAPPRTDIYDTVTHIAG